MTPYLFDELIKRKRAADRIQFICAGITAAAVYNAGFSPPEKPVSPLDFVPGEPKPDDGFDLRKLDPDQQAAYVLGVFTQGRYTKKA